MTLHLARKVCLFDAYILLQDANRTGEFPLLVDADQKITGFTNIVSHLRENYSHNLDANITPQQQRDRTAYDTPSKTTSDLVVLTVAP
jgi:hypothetical protein